LIATIETPGIRACEGSSTVPPMAEFTCANAALQGERQNNAIVRLVVTSFLIGIPPYWKPILRRGSRVVRVSDTPISTKKFLDVDFCGRKYKVLDENANIFD